MTDEQFANIREVSAKILERGNNAEIKCTKDGVIVLEVQKTIRGKV